MAKLIYGMGQASLDGYVASKDGSFGWVEPGEDLHLHAGAELMAAGTTIYGRKMYDLMVFWETADKLPDIRAASEFPGEVLAIAGQDRRLQDAH